MQITLKRGTPNPILRLLLFGEKGDAKKGLTDGHSDLNVAYIREGDSKPTSIKLTFLDKDVQHVPGGFREIDPDLMPGLYELTLPDEICADGANRATLMIKAPGVVPQVVHLDLVAYDPYDSYRLGLDCLSREDRHNVISRAFREVVPEIVKEFRSEGKL